MKQNTYTLLTILSLIFAYPIGIFLLWKRAKFKDSFKVILTLIFSLFVPQVVLFIAKSSSVSEVNMKNLILSGTISDNNSVENFKNETEELQKEKVVQNPEKDNEDLKGNFKKGKSDIRNTNKKYKSVDENKEIKLTKSKKSTSKNPNHQIVYVTPTGKKYHYKKSCGAGVYIPIPLNEAKEKGYSPCKKCVE